MSDDTVKRPRGRPKSIDRDAVAQRAMGHYWKEGLHAASINELCGRIEISKPGLYREFGGEDGLMHAALEHYREQAVLPLMSLFLAGLPFAEAIDRALEVMTEPGERPAGCMFTRMRLDRARLGPETRPRLERIEAERLEALEVCIERAQGVGEVRPNVTPAFGAAYLDAQLTLVLTRMAVGEHGEVVRDHARLALGALQP